MFDQVDKDIKKIFKVSVLLLVVGIIVGIVTLRMEIYFGLTIGSIVSIINAYMLYVAIYNLVQYGVGGKKQMHLEYTKRLGITSVGLLLVIYVSKMFFPTMILNNAFGAIVGIFNFKISMYIVKFIKFKRKES